MLSLLCVITLALAQPGQLAGTAGEGGVHILDVADPASPRLKPEEAFEFAKKPKVTRDGDKVAVSFAVKAFCDVTVAIENAEGKIVRHLACGVLGPNAPEPFQKNSKMQFVVWDGKNEKGEYVDKDAVTVRVSLGLKAQYERNLMWCPKKRGPTVNPGVGYEAPRIVATPEGVYVLDGESAGEHVRLFDHEGNYVRTVYPFPAGRVKDVVGLKTLAAPGLTGPCPLRWSSWQFTMLTASEASFGDDWPPRTEARGIAVTAMAVEGNRIALVGSRVNRLATDGSSGGQEFEGPVVSYLVKVPLTMAAPGGTFPFGPRSAAIDPKGGWLYLTGYACWPPTRANQNGLHGVVRVRLDGKAPPQVFAGDMDKDKPGMDDAHLWLPLCVVCDAAGRVYVCDYMNDRIQVFSAAGALLKTLRTPKPVELRIRPDNGELFVFSWAVANDRLVVEYEQARARHDPTKILPRLTRYEPIDWSQAGKEAAARSIASYPLPIRGFEAAFVHAPYVGPFANGLQCRVGVDFWALEPRVWIAEGVIGDPTESWNGNILLLAVKKDGLELVRDFSKDVAKEDPHPRPPYHGRQRLYFDHRNRKLYLGEAYLAYDHVKSFKDAIQFDPETGSVKIVPLPFDCEDMAFDMDGHAYLRTSEQVARYDAQTWREVPFDYGEVKEGVGHGGSGGRRATVISAVEVGLDHDPSSQFYGMCVSPKGHVAITGYHRAPASSRKDEKNVAVSRVTKYEPRIYPGRPTGSLVHVFDAHGKSVYEDALPGACYFQGIAMDKDDNLYLQHSGMPLVAGKFPPKVHLGACTLIKLKPKSRFLSADEAIIPLSAGARPDRPQDFLRQGSQPMWIESAQWMYGGVGLSTKGMLWGNCHCFANSRFGFDYFARSFVSELDRYRVSVLDTSGNVIVRIGRYGNADDGKPLVATKASPAARSIGGDEVSLMQPLFLAVETDRRLFVADIGNYRIISVKLDYHATERVALRDVEEGPK